MMNTRKKITPPTLCAVVVATFAYWFIDAAAMAKEDLVDDHPRISGIWQVTKYETGIRTIDGKLPPLTPEGEKIYQKNLVEKKGLKPRNDMTRCVPSGTPRVMWAPYPTMILQTARKISFVHEYQHQLRHIYMDEPLPKMEDIELSFMGESVGRWDGDTLVIETIGLHKTTTLDREGMPHSPNMKLTERIRLIDGGKHLEDVMTIDDPEMYKTPWTARVVLERKPNTQLKEYNCLKKYEDY